MPRRPRQQPFHQPIGLSPEGDTTRRWILTLVLVILVLAAGVAARLLLTDRI
jgi:hypothetical protein